MEPIHKGMIKQLLADMKVPVFVGNVSLMIMVQVLLKVTVKYCWYVQPGIVDSVRCFNVS